MSVVKEKLLVCASLCMVMCTAWPQSDKEAPLSLQPEVETVSSTAESPWIQMYGVRLSSATREEMRQALRHHGIKVVREDARYWVDVYDAKDVLKGATQFYVGYAAASRQLAFAEYGFDNFMDSSQTQLIVKMVTLKYGSPTETAGQLAMGSYTARWRLTDGMQIQVTREWPETATYLKFFNTRVETEMKAELENETRSRQAVNRSEAVIRSPFSGSLEP